LKVLPTIFDSDYDYTKWPELEHQLNIQSSYDNLYSLLQSSDNKLLQSIKYNFYLMNQFCITSICFIWIGIFLVLLFADNWYIIQYINTFLILFFLMLAMIFWGLSNQDIELYNKSFQCHADVSIIILSSALANSCMMVVIFFLPSINKQYLQYQQNLHGIYAQVSDQTTSNSSSQ